MTAEIVSPRNFKENLRDNTTYLLEKSLHLDYQHQRRRNFKRTLIFLLQTLMNSGMLLNIIPLILLAAPFALEMLEVHHVAIECPIAIVSASNLLETNKFTTALCMPKHHRQTIQNAISLTTIFAPSVLLNTRPIIIFFVFYQFIGITEQLTCAE